MELLEYSSLKNLMRNKIPLSEKQLKIITKQLLNCLDYLHNKGICHRDITMDNILISNDLSTLKLIDFGVSKFFNLDSNDFMLTPTGIPQFRAPEILDGEKYTEKSDIWMIGLMIYSFLSDKIFSTKKFIILK